MPAKSMAVILFMQSGDRNSMAASQGEVEVPREIDVHLKIFGKEP